MDRGLAIASGGYSAWFLAWIIPFNAWPQAVVGAVFCAGPFIYLGETIALDHSFDRGRKRTLAICIAFALLELPAVLSGTLAAIPAAAWALVTTAVLAFTVRRKQTK